MSLEESTGGSVPFVYASHVILVEAADPGSELVDEPTHRRGVPPLGNDDQRRDPRETMRHAPKLDHAGLRPGQELGETGANRQP